MEALGGGSDSRGIPPSSPRGGGGGSSRSFAVPFSASNLFQAPLSALLEYSGILQPVVRQSEREILIPSQGLRPALVNEPVVYAQGGGGGGGGREVSIRIIGTGYQENLRVPAAQPQHPVAGPDGQGSSSGSDDGISAELTTSTLDRHGGEDGASSAVHGAATSSSSSSASVDRHSMDGEANVTDGNNRNSSYQRYDIQQIARWIEQILPFSLLLLVVFIRQHLQGFFITIWISIVMFKSNDILRKQTALKACAFATNNYWCIKRNQVNLPYVVLVVTSVLFAFVEFVKSNLAGERIIPVLVGIMLIFMIHIFSIYWWCRNDDLLYPLIMLPPKEIPSFWHAIFIILVNDVMVRQAAMVLKCTLLLYYKNRRGRSYLKQAQMLTLVEYLILLYRSLLPTPVWYRFFLNKEYGSLFSSLTTGLYLTFKLTSVVEKVQSFVSALKALSHKEIHYGSYATNEQVLAAGDLCAICQEKMHVPVLLRCKHIFCEDCVSEWFERERTCPLCRALVKPAGLRSFGDGSTSLFFQMF